MVFKFVFANSFAIIRKIVLYLCPKQKKIMIPPLNTNWNVLYTAPRAEKQVKERIAALGVECFYLYTGLRVCGPTV